MGITGDKIRVVVTAEKFDKIFSIDDWFNFEKLTQTDMYNYLLKFVEDENGKPLPEEEARALFKNIPRSEWLEYLTNFITGMRDAFVNPTNGGS